MKVFDFLNVWFIDIFGVKHDVNSVNEALFLKIFSENIVEKREKNYVTKVVVL